MSNQTPVEQVEISEAIEQREPSTKTQEIPAAVKARPLNLKVKFIYKNQIHGLEIYRPSRIQRKTKTILRQKASPQSNRAE